VALVVRIKLAVYLSEKEHKLGPGKVRLLEAIGNSGSISAAARSMGMAYRHAWELVDDLNRCFATPVVAMSIGGRDGGGAKLTPWGQELIERFHRMEEAARWAIGRDLDPIVDSIVSRTPRTGRQGAPRPRNSAKAERRRPRS
jgi:molybdate transport system regulatory protein